MDEQSTQASGDAPVPTSDAIVAPSPVAEPSVITPEQAPATDAIQEVAAQGTQETPTTPQVENPSEKGHMPASDPFNSETAAVVAAPSAPEVTTVELTADAKVEAPATSLNNPAPQNTLKLLLKKAGLAIQTRKQKSLDEVMQLFVTKNIITNDDVENFLEVSDTTAARYLSQLESAGKIKQTGKGRGVSYTKV